MNSKEKIMKNSKHLFSLTFILIALSACVTNTRSPEHYLMYKDIATPKLENFSHCHGYGCKFISDITLSDKEWRNIISSFSPTPDTATKERASIAASIAAFEKRVGAKTGTDEDVYGTFQDLGTKQLDCIDESTNTTIYLMLLREKGLINFHTVEPPKTRIPFINHVTWPHQTAQIIEKETGTPYVVDSWFHDNGYPPEIVTLEQWNTGWKPNEHKRNSPEKTPP